MESLHVGGPFYWCNRHEGRTWKWARLDCTLMNVACLEGCPNITMKYLARNSSNHAPLIISSEASVPRYGLALFKFQQMWTTHEDIMKCVEEAWGMEVVGSRLWRLAAKLKKIRIVLKVWNKEVFGFTDIQIKKLEHKIVLLDGALQENYSEEVERELLAAKLELSVWLQREESRLAQQAKQKWVENGDANAQFFRVSNGKSQNNVKVMRLGSGRILESLETIHNGAVQYFEEFM